MLFLVSMQGTEQEPFSSYYIKNWSIWGCFLFVWFWFFGHAAGACGILVPRPGIKPAPLAVEARSLNHWTAGEVPGAF